MSQQRSMSRKLAGGALLGAMASGLAATAFGSAGPASATCASISGVGNGGGCTSTPTSFAVGLGTGATAKAQGLFDAAVAAGTDSFAFSRGNLDTALAVGNAANAEAGVNPNDTGNLAVDIGNNPGFGNGVQASGTNTTPGFGNVAIALGDNNALLAIGSFNSAFSVGPDNTVVAEGFANNATNLVGSENFVRAEGGTGLTNPGLSEAFNIGGNKNIVLAQSGPFAVAGAIGLNGKTISQTGTGVNVHTPLNP